MKTLALFLLLLSPVAAWAYWQRSSPVSRAAMPPSPPRPLEPDALNEPSFLEDIGLALMAMTRGERNNNPGNIRISASNWQGKVQGADKAFETFEDPVKGIRALAKLLRNYQAQGFDTVRMIINRYAPPVENNTDSYIRAVAAALGVSPDAKLTLDDAQLQKLVAAIIKHENGRNIYSAADIATAVSLA